MAFVNLPALRKEIEQSVIDISKAHGLECVLADVVVHPDRRGQRRIEVVVREMPSIVAGKDFVEWKDN